MTDGLDGSYAQAAIRRAHTAFKHWIYQHALPFWSSTGYDLAGCGFVEHLALGGVSAAVPYKRMRVQARQIYVFSHAALLGVCGAIEPAERGFAFMTAHGRREDGGWVRRMGPEGGTVDETADLYDLAFVLFALAWYARSTRSGQAIELAYGTTRWIFEHMSSRSGGFCNTLPIEAGPRQQNPHMHLLEAMLALFETTRDPYFIGIAGDLVDLFQCRFYDPETATLGEFFNEDWSRMACNTGTHIEPGHHYEWVWLLHEYARLTGQATPEEAVPLYRFANTHGVDRKTGLVVDVVDRKGNWRGSSARIWPQTEAIKAHLAMADTPYGQPAEVARIVENLLSRFFKCDPRGTWIDHMTLEGVSKADKIPSSSLYHIFMAFAELDKAVRTL